MVEIVQQRCEALLAHPADSLRARPLTGSSWSALELAALACVDLDAAASGLAQVLGTAGPHPVPAWINAPTAAANILAPSVLLGAVKDHAAGLAAVIHAAGITSDENVGLGDTGAAGIVQFVLSRTIDHLDDAEGVLHAATAVAGQRPVH
jgi:hypothetical protein